MQRTLSAEQIEEVDKCFILCRYCHGIVHSQDIKGSIVIRSSIEGRVVSQELKGWFVNDNVDKTLKFMSNERNLLQPCFVTLGSGEAEEYFILELMQKNCLLNWLSNLESHQRIEIVSASDGKLLLDIVYEVESRANIRMALGLPIFAMNFDVTEGSSVYLWLRNGMVLTKEGSLHSEGEIQFLLNIQR
jgi:hypothetical protein